MKIKKILLGLIGFIVLWTAMAGIDFALVHNYRKPIFCIGVNLADDGGSGKYVGLGYSFKLEGGFMPEDGEPDISSYRGYLLRREISRGFWDKSIVQLDIAPTEESIVPPETEHTEESMGVGLMADGVFYEISPWPMPAEIDESAIIGYVKSYTDTFPDEDGETNISQEAIDAPYAKVKGGIAILYQHEWYLCTPESDD